VRFVRVVRSLLTGLALSLRRVRAERLRPPDFTPFEATLDAVTPVRRHELDELVDEATIARLQDLMANGALTSEELTVHLLARTRQFDERLGSVIELNPDALAEARAADARRRDGAPLGPLDGIPVTLKDNIETTGPMRTTAGAMVLADRVAERDAPVASALRAAGAVILGKANLSELAGAVIKTPGVSAVGGATRNPYGAAFTPGGSSSGSAVGVAAGLCVVSVGTETSGSLIAPAAFNGVVGIKPTHGLIDTGGIVPLVRRQDTAGAIGRCVADAAALLDAIAGRGSGTATSCPTELRDDALHDVPVAVLRDDILSQRSPIEDTSDNAAVLDRILDGLTRAGASATMTAMPADAVAKFDATFSKVVLGGLSCDTIGYLAAAGTSVRTLAELHAFNLADARHRMPQGQFFVDLAYAYDIDEVSYERATEEHQRAASEILDRTFDASGTDLLVSITNRHSSLYATAGCPAITVPLGLRDNGMPVGVTFIGRHDDDAQLVARAHAFEQATRWRVPPKLGSDS
jgi:amidase